MAIDGYAVSIMTRGFQRDRKASEKVAQSINDYYERTGKKPTHVIIGAGIALSLSQDKQMPTEFMGVAVAIDIDSADRVTCSRAEAVWVDAMRRYGYGW